MRTGKLGTLANEIDRLRVEIPDIDTKGLEAWREIERLQASGGMPPDAEAMSAAQQVLLGRYRSKAAQLQQQLVQAEQTRVDTHEERRRLQNNIAAYEERIARDGEQAALYEQIMRKFDEGMALAPMDTNVREAVRFAKGSLIHVTERVAQARQALADIARELEAVGSE